MLQGTSEVLANLRGSGFKVGYDYLAWLIRSEYFTPPNTMISSRRVWGLSDVERLKEELIRRKRSDKKTRK